MIQWCLAVKKIFAELAINTVAAARPIAEAKAVEMASVLFQAFMTEPLMAPKGRPEAQPLDEATIHTVGFCHVDNHKWEMIRTSC